MHILNKFYVDSKGFVSMTVGQPANWNTVHDNLPMNGWYFVEIRNNLQLHNINGMKIFPTSKQATRFGKLLSDSSLLIKHGLIINDLIFVNDCRFEVVCYDNKIVQAIINKEDFGEFEVGQVYMSNKGNDIVFLGRGKSYTKEVPYDRSEYSHSISGYVFFDMDTEETFIKSVKNFPIKTLDKKLTNMSNQMAKAKFIPHKQKPSFAAYECLNNFEEKYFHYINYKLRTKRRIHSHYTAELAYVDVSDRIPANHENINISLEVFAIVETEYGSYKFKTAMIEGYEEEIKNEMADVIKENLQ